VLSRRGSVRDRRHASGGRWRRSNIHFLGRRTDAEGRELLRNARAFLFAANEDFGIAPIEAQASGTPVIAFGREALETVRGLDADGPIDCFFDEQTPTSVLQAIERFENLLAPIDPEDCRANASRFRSEVFRDHLHEIVSRHWARVHRASGCGLETPAAAFNLELMDRWEAVLRRVTDRALALRETHSSAQPVYRP
jgi:glycosyltransferase involved in cell wall biosynthesis